MHQVVSYYTTAITSQCYTIHLLMLHMSKAFDKVDRVMLLKDLKTIFDPDELHLIKIMIKIMLNTELTVRCQIEESDFVSSQSKENNDHICNKSTTELSSISKHDHRKDLDKHFAIYQEYADHISAITGDKNKIDHIKKTVR